MFKKFLLFVLIMSTVTFGAYLYGSNYGLENIKINNIAVSDEKIPENYDGFSIAHVSDLYISNIYDASKFEVSMHEIYLENPEVLIIDGNFLSDFENIDAVDYQALSTSLKNTQVQYGIFYVPATNEVISPELSQVFYDANVMVLNNSCQKIYYDAADSYINICGYNDPVQVEVPDDGTYNILVMNDPDLAKQYYGQFDLILSGKNLGNVQIGETIFEPTLTTNLDPGQYEEKNTTHIVSSGIGTKETHFRLLNRPEIQIITLQK